MTKPITSRSDDATLAPAGPVLDDSVLAESSDTTASPRSPWWRRGLPIVIAIALFLTVWQVVVWSGWKPDYLLPGPVAVLGELGRLASELTFWQALGRTLTRAVAGFGLAVGIGTVIGLAAARSRLLRSAIGSLVTGLQTMPSVVWFPLAILLLGLGEQAIMFVVVLGAAPSIANGVLTGVDQGDDRAVQHAGHGALKDFLALAGLERADTFVVLEVVLVIRLQHLGSHDFETGAFETGNNFSDDTAHHGVA